MRVRVRSGPRTVLKPAQPNERLLSSSWLGLGLGLGAHPNPNPSPSPSPSPNPHRHPHPHPSPNPNPNPHLQRAARGGEQPER